MGAWSWGVGGNGGDRVFGNTLTKEDLWPVFRRGMDNLWDTAAVYGMGASETILGEFVDDSDRDDLDQVHPADCQRRGASHRNNDG